jgi:NAD(P)H-hydrate epimerase
VFVGSAARLETGSADFRKNLALWRGLGLGVDVVETEVQASDLGRAVQAAALVVDALFGTGLERPLDQPWKAAIEAVNASGRPVLAVDLPSGLDADSGAALGALVRATATVTFVAKKPGLTRGLGREAAGRVRVAEIGIPRGWLGAGVTAE